MAKLFYEHYIKLAHIGKGANAHVYKVRHAELGYVRAIKILNDYIENKDEKLYQSFLKECRTLLTIGNGCHPSIVRIYQPDLIDNHAVVEMDYVQGTTLDNYVRQQRFINFKEIIRFIQDIVGALAYTHHDIYRFLMNPEEDKLEVDPNDGSKYLIDADKEKELVVRYGIAHNDLHSNNIMRRDYDGGFVLLDFGLAVQDGRCVKSSHVGDGNPEYMAPEKFDSDKASPRSDVYSLGILIYEMLAGRVPFELEYTPNGMVTAQSKNKILNQHLSATPPEILPLRRKAFEAEIPGAFYERDYPEWLDDVIMKCLAKNPQDRYEDAKALLDEIRHLQETSSNDKKRKESEENASVVDNLKNEIEILSKQYVHEKTEKDKLSLNMTALENENRKLISRINALEAAKGSTSQKGRKKWIITMAVFSVLLAGVGTWGYCMLLNFNNRDYQLHAFMEEATRQGFYNDSTGDWQNLPAVSESMTGELSDSSPGISQRIDTVLIKPDPKVVTKTETKTVVEYRTPPEVQKELDRLRSRNSQLEGQVKRYKESLPQ